MNLAATAHGQLAGQAHHAFDLHHAVAAYIDGLGGGALLVAEVNAAGQFAHHHDVDAMQQLRLDGRGIEHGGVRHHGAQVGE
jgi:hypothetical protein